MLSLARCAIFPTRRSPSSEPPSILPGMLSALPSTPENKACRTPPIPPPWKDSTPPCQAAPSQPVHFTLSLSSKTARFRFSAASASPLPTVRKSKPSSIASTPSTPRLITRPATTPTLSISTQENFSARTLPACRFAPWRSKLRPSKLSLPALLIVATKSTRPISRSSTSSKVSMSIMTSVSPTSKALSNSSTAPCSATIRKSASVHTSSPSPSQASKST